MQNLTAISSDLAYSNHITDNLTVLSSKDSEKRNGVLQGLLYVPDLLSTDPCVEDEIDYVPTTVVRQTDLPQTNYNLIALAPWYSTNCTKAYLSSARMDPIRAFIFYRPDSNSSKPPSVDSPIWDLDDDGKWRSQNHYPIFAIPGPLGAEMMYQLSLYSGNVTNVPYGQNISTIYHADADDYVRIWTELTVTTPDGLPKMWVFILVMIAVVLVILSFISLLIQFIWRRRRRSLRQRVATGEVNLEAMGIKQMTVPLCHVEQFPVFTYHYEPAPLSPLSPSSPPPPLSPLSSSRRASFLFPDGAAASALPSDPATPTSSAIPDPLAQPACRICLKAFENRVTVIRELPCGHIFHPECIDKFLSQISSLCPRCKASMLPLGFCPPITNAIVRRERATRRLRERILISDSEDGSIRGRRIQSWGSLAKKHFHGATATHNSFSAPGDSVVAVASASPPRDPEIELDFSRPRPGLSSSRQGKSGPRQIQTDQPLPSRGPSETSRPRMRQLVDKDESSARASIWTKLGRKNH